jgi:hypothetical protein
MSNACTASAFQSESSGKFKSSVCDHAMCVHGESRETNECLERSSLSPQPQQALAIVGAALSRPNSMPTLSGCELKRSDGLGREPTSSLRNAGSDSSSAPEAQVRDHG